MSYQRGIAPLWQRELEKLRKPTYRNKLLVFGLLGGVLLAIAIGVLKDVARETILGLAVTIWGVAFVQLLWGFVGGDPLTDRMEQMETQHGRSLRLLTDFVDGHIGIERVWRDRLTWTTDGDAGLGLWHTRLAEASRVVVISNTFWSNWLTVRSFATAFLEHVAHATDVSARVVLYHPDGDVLAMRARDEGERQWHGQTQMQQEIIASLRKIKAALETWDSAARGRLQLRLERQFNLPAQILWADDRMLVALYLAGRSGSASPTFQLFDPRSAYFRAFAEEAEAVWDRAEPMEYEQLVRLLEEQAATPGPESA